VWSDAAPQTLTRDGRLVAGAGATEMELARQLREFGENNATMEQYAILKFAEVFIIFFFCLISHQLRARRWKWYRAFSWTTRAWTRPTPLLHSLLPTKR
jgi:hypothetical protein